VLINTHTITKVNTHGCKYICSHKNAQLYTEQHSLNAEATHD